MNKEHGYQQERRAELEEEVPDGCYSIGTEGSKIFTGKQGYIQYSIVIEDMLFEQILGKDFDRSLSLKEIRALKDKYFDRYETLKGKLPPKIRGTNFTKKRKNR